MKRIISAVICIEMLLSCTLGYAESEETSLEKDTLVELQAAIMVGIAGGAYAMLEPVIDEDATRNDLEEVQYVREAYFEAINAPGESDVKYNEMYEMACQIYEMLQKEQRSMVEDECVLIFGDVASLSDEELMQKTEAFLEIVIDGEGDKISTLMQKFMTMNSVSGIIEPARVSIEIKNMSEFVAELGWSHRTVGYILAMLDIYDYSWIGDGEELFQFKDSGFTFEWEAIGDYELVLNGDYTEELERGDSGEAVKRLQERLFELGFSTGIADGIFGRNTADAVYAFQERNGIEATGIADRATQRVLYSEDALGTNFGFTINEFIELYHQISSGDYQIKKEGDVYHVCDWLGNADMAATFLFETDTAGKVTSISFSGEKLSQYGLDQIYACMFAFGVVISEGNYTELVQEFKRVCGTGEITVVDGVKYMYVESRALDVLWLTMEIE